MSFVLEWYFNFPIHSNCIVVFFHFYHLFLYALISLLRCTVPYDSIEALPLPAYKGMLHDLYLNILTILRCHVQGVGCSIQGDYVFIGISPEISKMFTPHEKVGEKRH